MKRSLDAVIESDTWVFWNRTNNLDAQTIADEIYHMELQKKRTTIEIPNTIQPKTRLEQSQRWK